MNKKLDIFSKIEHHSLPKWEDLPELDLYMDQVIVLMEKYLNDNSSEDSKLITPSMINNYVKLGVMPAPVKKKYSREHIAYLVIICSLKQVISIANIKEMIDMKLQQNSISEILNFYSELNDFAFTTFSEACYNSIQSESSLVKTLEDASLFTSIAANNFRNISVKIFMSANKNTEKITKKKKDKSK